MSKYYKPWALRGCVTLLDDSMFVFNRLSCSSTVQFQDHGQHPEPKTFKNHLRTEQTFRLGRLHNRNVPADNSPPSSIIISPMTSQSLFNSTKQALIKIKSSISDYLSDKMIQQVNCSVLGCRNPQRLWEPSAEGILEDSRPRQPSKLWRRVILTRRGSRRASSHLWQREWALGHGEFRWEKRHLSVSDSRFIFLTAQMTAQTGSDQKGSGNAQKLVLRVCLILECVLSMIKNRVWLIVMV